MAAVPITINGVMFPKKKGGVAEAVPMVIVGIEWNPALSVGGGPVYPDPPGGEEIWPNPPEGTAPIPEHPIVIPPPPDEIPPEGSAPVPPHQGWNWSAAKSGWYFLYVPGAGTPQPKK